MQLILYLERNIDCGNISSVSQKTEIPAEDANLSESESLSGLRVCEWHAEGSFREISIGWFVKRLCCRSVGGGTPNHEDEILFLGAPSLPRCTSNSGMRLNPLVVIFELLVLIALLLPLITN